MYNKFMTQLNGIVSDFNRAIHNTAMRNKVPTGTTGQMKLEWCPNEDECLHGTLTVADQTLGVQADDDGNCILMQSFSDIGERSVELPLDATKIFMVLTLADLPVVTEPDGDKLLVVGVAAHVLWDDLTGKSFGAIVCQVTRTALNVYHSLLATWAARAAQSCKDGPRIEELYQRLQQGVTREFDRWLEVENSYSPGERLYFDLFADHQGDRNAAAAWWRELCDHDYWQDREFVRQFVYHIGSKLAKKAA